MTEEQENQPVATEETGARGQFEIQKIYVKNVSLETPSSPQIFREQWKPAVHMDIANSTDNLGDNLYEVTLSVTATVKHEEKTVYLAEVQQAGIFRMVDFPKEITGRLLATMCPNILFPFVREMISDLVTRAGFPQLLLAPINFDAVYQQHLQQRAAASETQH